MRNGEVTTVTAQERRWQVARAMVAAGMVTSLAACSGQSTEPAQTQPESRASGETVRVYLATALACSKLEDETARFFPLEVDGAEATEVEGCQEQEIFNSYVYEIQAPDSGDVTVTPGNQPPATFDAAQAVAAGAVTIFYARKGEGRYEVSTTVYGKDDAVASAP